MAIERNIASILQARMEAQHKTKSEFAAELGVPRSTLQGYLKWNRSLRSDSIEDLAAKLNISPTQLIGGTPEVECSTDDLFDVVLQVVQTFHPHVQQLAQESLSVLQSAWRISVALASAESDFQTASMSTVFTYSAHESWDAFQQRWVYGIIGQEQMTDGSPTTIRVAPFTTNRSAAIRLARLCTECRLSPIHLQDVVQDFLSSQE